MKKSLIASALTLALASASAQAGVYKCMKTGGSAETDTSYLLVLNLNPSGGKAAIFTDMAGGGSNWELQYGEATATMAMDGGPLSISGTDTTKVNWRRERGCYKFMKGTLRFTLDLDSRGTRGELRILPNIQTKPNVMCSIPRPLVPPPVELTCDEL